MQIFIRIKNSFQNLNSEIKNTSKDYWDNNKQKKEQLLRRIAEYKEAFGEEPTTTYVYHHQWLYGRSALLGLINVLTIAKYGEDHNNPFKENSYFTGEESIHAVKYTLSLFNSRLASLIGRVGIEGFRLLNFNEPEMREDFSRGDNNDGVLIIDAISHKYAFVNIGGDSTINQLKRLDPVSAERYVRLYYPQNATDSATNCAPKDGDFENYWRTNTRINRLFIKALAPFEVLSTEELIKLFPKVYLNSNKI